MVNSAELGLDLAKSKLGFGFAPGKPQWRIIVFRAF